jgi:sn-1 stearoyl-lipid 9-desaturase
MHTISTDRMISDQHSDAVEGRVRWVPSKSIWTLAMLAIAVVGGPLTFSWDALLVFLVFTAFTICAGHSVGMHRLLIHRSFEAPKWLERSLVYLGTLVGMAGPFGMIAAHDIRDWAQRQTACHDLYAHRKGFWRDAWWQMHCAVDLKHPPRFVIEKAVRNDPFYKFVEKTWMLQQLPWAILLFAVGDIGWVVWGIAVRITFSLHGHWLVGHFAHRRGHQGWVVDGVAVQGFNIPHISLLTFGENWHGNHHAYPGSARLGVERGQLDPGWWLIKVLEFVGLAWSVREPAQVGEREGLRKVQVVKRRNPKKLPLFAAWVAATTVGSAIPLLLAPNFSTAIRIFLAIGGFAALFIVVAGIPTIRFKLKDAATDQTRGLLYYIGTASLLGFLCSFVVGPGFFILAIFFVPCAAAAGLAFGIFNRRSIARFLEQKDRFAALDDQRLA